MAAKSRTKVYSPEADPNARPGGYHDRGVPGEEAKLRRFMRVRKPSEGGRTIEQTGPIKGGMKAEGLAEQIADRSGLTGSENRTERRAVYVIGRQDGDELETPVFAAGESGRDKAVAVFTAREPAAAFLQTTDLPDPGDVIAMSPYELGEWLQAAMFDGVRLVAVNLSGRAQREGGEQDVLLLDEIPDRSGENLYREIQDASVP